jgi:hypothetical protein
MRGACTRELKKSNASALGNHHRPWTLVLLVFPPLRPGRYDVSVANFAFCQNSEKIHYQGNKEQLQRLKNPFVRASILVTFQNQSPSAKLPLFSKQGSWPMIGCHFAEELALRESVLMSPQTEHESSGRQRERSMTGSQTCAPQRRTGTVSVATGN